MESVSKTSERLRGKVLSHDVALAEPVLRIPALKRRGLCRTLSISLLSWVLLACGPPGTRQVYHVSETQLAQMAQIAGITPCAHGPTVVAGLKRHKGGGVLYVDCPLGGR